MIAARPIPSPAATTPEIQYIPERSIQPIQAKSPRNEPPISQPIQSIPARFQSIPSQPLIKSIPISPKRRKKNVTSTYMI
jgi:hypothetical protein